MELTILFFFTPTDYTWLAVRSSDPILTVESQDKGMLPAPELPDGLPCFPLPLYLDGLLYLWYSQACLGFTATTGTSNHVTPAANNPLWQWHHKTWPTEIPCYPSSRHVAKTLLCLGSSCGWWTNCVCALTYDELSNKKLKRPTCHWWPSNIYSDGLSCQF